MKKLQIFLVVTLNAFLLFSETESIIIPILIYVGIERGWFTKSHLPSPAPLPTPTTRATTTVPTTTTEELPLDSVEYVLTSRLNPCGYGPLPAFNPRNEWFSGKNPNGFIVSEKRLYIYSQKDVGGGDLGKFLLHSLQAMHNPNFYTNNAFSHREQPKFNHYKIHRHSFNQMDIPRRSNIDANFIIECTKDSTLLCPSPTTSLCTSNGAILCVANHTSTAPCSSYDNLDCVSSTYLDPGKTVEIACVSDAKVSGHIAFNSKDNTIVSKEKDKEIERQQQATADQAKKFFDDMLVGKRVEDQLSIGVFNMQFLDEVMKQTNIHFHETMNAEVTTAINEPTTENVEDINSEKTENDFCVTILALPVRKHR